jgi:hypothetical protein
MTVRMRMKTTMKPKYDPIPVPHSWALDDWPPTIYPRTASKARYITRTHRAALVAAGALVRVGRDLVVIGEPYMSWLSSHVSRVDKYVYTAAATAATKARVNRKINQIFGH